VMHLLVFLLLGICLGTVQADPEGKAKREFADTPRNLFTHFVVSIRNLEKSIEELDIALETHYAAWGLDTIDTDETFGDDVEDLIRCDNDNECELELDVFFTLETTLSEDQDDEVCRFIEDYLSGRARLIGDWGCTTDLANGTSTGYYVATLDYTENEEDHGYKHEVESEFVYSIWKMQQAAYHRDFANDIEKEFSGWDMDTIDAENLLDYFDRNYECDFSDDYCELEFILPFTIDGSSLSDEDIDELCEAIQAFFSTQADVGGDWDCRVLARESYEYSNLHYAVMTYSEGGGLTFGEKIGIIAGSITLFMLLLAVIVLLVMATQSKSRADYV